MVPPREPVVLNVYDLLWTNKISSKLGMGIYHSGVQVYGREYSFGFHDLPVTGIYHHEPRQAGQLGRKFQVHCHAGLVKKASSSTKRTIGSSASQ